MNKVMNMTRLEAAKIKTKYREVKDHNGETEQARITCKFYKELDRISLFLRLCWIQVILPAPR